MPSTAVQIVCTFVYKRECALAVHYPRKNVVYMQVHRVYTVEVRARERGTEGGKNERKREGYVSSGVVTANGIFGRSRRDDRYATGKGCGGDRLHPFAYTTLGHSSNKCH